MRLSFIVTVHGECVNQRIVGYLNLAQPKLQRSYPPQKSARRKGHQLQQISQILLFGGKVNGEYYYLTYRFGGK